MKKRVSLNGSEVAGFIKERQGHAVRALKQSAGVFPKLAIVRLAGNPAVDAYLRVKQAYAEDIGAEIEVHVTDAKKVDMLLSELSNNESIQGLILQLPFDGLKDVDSTLKNIVAKKDVDNLRGDSPFDAPTPTAILWLLAGYNVDLLGKNIVVVGRGRLVGEPLVKLLIASGLDPQVVDENTENGANIISSADILISGVGKPDTVKSASIKPGTVVIDAGVASDKGVLKGDVEEAARLREDISVSPRIGGVGPLTVAALFENLLKACR